jgi:hypothetical protein
MGRGHWQRLRTNGGGPRGGGGGHDKGPLRKVVRHRKAYTVAALPPGKAHWSDWTVLLETEEYFAARDRLRAEVEGGAWKDVRCVEGGWEEVLECGHAQHPVHDLIGETNAVRRRCRKCKRGAPPDVAPAGA